jgi:hypothetical protein
MIHNILHISDLHFTIDDKSYLRDNQEEFIEEVINEIISIESTIDFLFITGDFVERNKWENSDLISNVINKLESTLGVKQTFCVNGNHELDDDGIVVSEFVKLRNKLRIKNPTYGSNWFLATELADNHWVFEFNCFCNGKRKVKLKNERDFRPLKDSQLEELKNFIEKNLAKGKQNIYVLSHLPVRINPDSKLRKDKRWEDMHLWKDGENILEIFNENIKVNTLLWFAGDGHVIESYKQADSSNYFFLTGRFNGPIETYGEHRDKQIPKEASCQFIRVDTVKSNVIRTVQFSTVQHRYEQDSLKWYSKSLDFVSSTKNLNKFFTGHPKQDSLKRTITEIISNKGLYKLVKATTKRKNISLGWIDINRLLNSDILMKQFLECVSTLLDLEYKSNFNNMIILGLGYWGASVASFISLSKNIPSISVKVRGCNFSEHSIIANKIRNKNVIIATDVVASGETLDELREILGIENFTCLISIILNPCVISKLRGVDRIIYGTNQIALPLLEMENLPDIIIQSEYDFDKI